MTTSATRVQPVAACTARSAGTPLRPFRGARLRLRACECSLAEAQAIQASIAEEAKAKIGPRAAHRQQRESVTRRLDAPADLG